MNTVCEDEEHKENGLEKGEGGIGCDYDGRRWARSEDRRDEVGEEGRHGRRGKKAVQIVCKRSCISRSVTQS